MAAESPRLGEVVVDQSAAVLVANDELRRDPAVGVHDIRVAFRRLRSTLTVFGAYVPGASDGLVARLRDAAASLSTARDLEVLRASVEARGEPGQRIGLQHLEHVDEHAEVAEVLNAPGFLRTLEQVRGLAQVRVREPSRSRIDELITHELLRVQRRLIKATEATMKHRDERLHRLRKGVKRARYVLEPFGLHSPDAQTCEALASAQESLGRWQDAVVERQMTGETSEAHSVSEWISLAEELAELRGRIAASLSIRSLS